MMKSKMKSHKHNILQVVGDCEVKHWDIVNVTDSLTHTLNIFEFLFSIV